MGVTLKVYDKELVAALQKVTANGLAAATQHYHSRLKIAVNTPNTGSRKRGKDGRYKPTTYDNPSAPGEAPRKRTGFGQRGIVREIDRTKLEARVGVTKAAIYMYYLEMGTRSISPRPWMIATLNKIKGSLVALIQAHSLKG